jgi:hypothetical protein
MAIELFGGKTSNGGPGGSGGKFASTVVARFIIRGIGREGIAALVLGMLVGGQTSSSGT